MSGCNSRVAALQYAVLFPRFALSRGLNKIIGKNDSQMVFTPEKKNF
jgi:hypothetical protein